MRDITRYLFARLHTSFDWLFGCHDKHGTKLLASRALFDNNLLFGDIDMYVSVCDNMKKG